MENPKPQLSFKENKGQVSDQNYKPRPDILFSGSDGKLNFHLRDNGISYQLSRVDSWRKADARIPGEKSEREVPSQITMYRIDINWLNANKKSQIKKEQALQGYDNYYLEVCPQGVTNVQSYKQITYQQLYKGIDLKWYEKNGNLKYDYIVSPGADHHLIQFEINGAEKISLDNKGQLILKTPLGEIVEESPFVTQNGKVLPAKWKIKNNVVSFDIKNVDASQTLIIDPLIRLWATYYGGSDIDEAWFVTCDASNNAIVSGITQSFNNIASIGAYQTVYGGQASGWMTGDVTLVKFDPTGTRLWGTYFGGAGNEDGQQCITIASGDIFVTGTTTSTNAAVMTTPGTQQLAYSGADDAYVVRFNSAGARVWSTYYGGTGSEWVGGLAVDAVGNCYVSGRTTTQSGPLIASAGCHQPISGGGQADAFIVKFNVVGLRIWGTFYGGGFIDHGVGCSVDNIGNVYLIGQTASPTGIATPGSYLPVYAGGGDGFIVKFDALGTRLWGTYYGDTGSDWGHMGACDPAGNLYVAGTVSNGWNPGNIASPGCHQSAYGGGTRDCFLAKFNPNGTRSWGTYYGGGGDDQWGYCSVNGVGNIYLSGQTTTSAGTAIATPCTYQEVNGGGTDCFFAKFNEAGVRQWGTFYGGSGSDYYAGSASDGMGNVYISGGTSTSSGTVIADPLSHQPIYGGDLADGFLAKFNGCQSMVLPNLTPPPDMTVCIGENTSLTTTTSVCGINWFDAPVDGAVLGTGTTITTPNLSITTTFYIGDMTCGTPTTLTPVEVTVVPLPNILINSTGAVLCAGGTSTLTANGATSYTWFPPQVTGAVLTVTASSTANYSVTGFDGSCFNTTTVNVEAVPFATLNLLYQQTPACYNSTLPITASGAQSYSWYPPSSLFSSGGFSVNTLPLQNNSTFTVIGFNTSGAVSCSTEATFSVDVVAQIIASISPSVEICEGSKTALTAGGGNTYTWLGANIEDADEPSVIVSPHTSGVYQANISVNNICPVTATVFVKVHPKPTVFAGNDTLIDLGDHVNISAIGDGALKWISGQNIDCFTCANTRVLPTTKSCYVVEVTDGRGCKAQDDICIEVRNDFGIYIPNTFTPNEDGINDIFYVYGFGIKDYKMSVYDRWGVKLFESTDQAVGWNGMYKGEFCQQGTYTYFVEYTPNKGKHEKRPGHVNIISGKP
ncbi:MAG: hypothetical protein K0S32_1299 [Bacteroidetes bacterium]|nr:hypothetical protein [Bacteroidota bacterium]